ncbi:MAG TPA: GFA family protein [Candidatus Limnocylindria bacterium]|nr:GFA family protein [Candidatus Limnocylindria bacterium]
MKTPFFGGCVCGAVRHECAAEPVEMFQCHSRDCQRASGGAGSCVVVLPAKSFKFTRGAPRHHFTTSAAGFQHKRGFCAECGSRLTGGENAEGTSPVVGINAASLDDPSWFRPQHNIITADAQPWDYMNSDVPNQRVSAPDGLKRVAVGPGRKINVLKTSAHSSCH